VRFSSVFPTVLSVFLRFQILPFEDFDWLEKMASQCEASNFAEKRKGDFFTGESKRQIGYFGNEKHLFFSQAPVLQIVIQVKIESFDGRLHSV
jgi:hypothetical protein